MGDTQRLWYYVQKTGEIGSYKQAGELTDFPRGVYLAYRDSLVTGFNSREEAEVWRKEHPPEEKP